VLQCVYAWMFGDLCICPLFPFCFLPSGSNSQNVTRHYAWMLQYKSSWLIYVDILQTQTHTPNTVQFVTHYAWIELCLNLCIYPLFAFLFVALRWQCWKCDGSLYNHVLKRPTSHKCSLRPFFFCVSPVFVFTFPFFCPQAAILKMWRASMHECFAIYVYIPSIFMYIPSVSIFFCVVR